MFSSKLKVEYESNSNQKTANESTAGQKPKALDAKLKVLKQTQIHRVGQIQLEICSPFAPLLGARICA